MASAGDNRALLRLDEANVGAVDDAISEIKLRKLLQEHSVNIMTDMHNQHVHLVEVMNASIDSKLDRHMAYVKENLAAVRAEMISEAVDAAKCVFVNMAHELNISMAATVRSEVSGLEKKVYSAMLGNIHSNSSISGSQKLSSSDSGSQRLSSSACSSVSSKSSASNSSRGVVSVRPWICPFCNVPLKHEKSFTDHMMLLSSRVHELPVVKVTRGGVIKSDKRCLFNFENSFHQAVVRPWSRDGLTFWDMAGLFMSELISRLHAGNSSTSSDSEVRHDTIFGFIDDCCSGKFVLPQ
jgi:hypothetical protein